MRTRTDLRRARLLHLRQAGDQLAQLLVMTRGGAAARALRPRQLAAQLIHMGVLGGQGLLGPRHNGSQWCVEWEGGLWWEVR